MASTVKYSEPIEKQNMEYNTVVWMMLREAETGTC
jgi:hypothetical protein